MTDADKIINLLHFGSDPAIGGGLRSPSVQSSLFMLLQDGPRYHVITRVITCK